MIGMQLYKMKQEEKKRKRIETLLHFIRKTTCNTVLFLVNSMEDDTYNKCQIYLFGTK